MTPKNEVDTRDDGASRVMTLEAQVKSLWHYLESVHKNVHAMIWDEMSELQENYANIINELADLDFRIADNFGDINAIKNRCNEMGRH